jgi:transcriptional regulator with XRE-family HTH domain
VTSVSLDFRPLAARRRASDTSQARLARILGCSPSALSHWERGTRKMNAETLVAIAIALGVPMYDLFISKVKKP